jgi:hypothetical protein
MLTAVAAVVQASGGATVAGEIPHRTCFLGVPRGWCGQALPLRDVFLLFFLLFFSVENIIGERGVVVLEGHVLDGGVGGSGRIILRRILSSVLSK